MQNREPQRNNSSAVRPIIKWPHLTSLGLPRVHDDYVEQFFVDTRTCLPDNVDLNIDSSVATSDERLHSRFNASQSRENQQYILRRRLRDFHFSPLYPSCSLLLMMTETDSRAQCMHTYDSNKETRRSKMAGPSHGIQELEFFLVRVEYFAPLARGIESSNMPRGGPLECVDIAFSVRRIMKLDRR